MKIAQDQVAFLWYGAGSLLRLKSDAEDCKSTKQEKAASHDYLREGL